MTNWIQVEERLPEDCDEVLVWCVEDGIGEHDIGSYERYWETEKMMGEYVTHWMPLPEPPEVSP